MKSRVYVWSFERALGWCKGVKKYMENELGMVLANNQ